jgi:glycosyltransferase involved in cell wall biosynthesis
LKKVTFMTNFIGHGGAGSQVYRVSAGLRERGWDVSVVTLQANKRSVDYLERIGVKLVCLEIYTARQFVTRLLNSRKDLAHLAPGVLVAFLFQPDLMARLVGKSAGFQCLISGIRNENIGSPRRERLFKFLDNRTDVVITNSRNVANALMARKAITRKPIRILHNGLDLREFSAGCQRSRQEVRQDLNLPQQAFVWLAVGQQRPQKNYPGLLQAFAASRRPNDYLVIAGGPHHRVDLNKSIDALGLKAQVRILGARSDVPELLMMADAFVMASHHEGSPNALIEAGAMGLPCVCTDVGGAKEIIHSNQSGLLVAPGDVATFSQAMLQLRNMSPRELSAMGMALKQNVESTYDIEVVLDEWEALLKVMQRSCSDLPWRYCDE